MHFYFYNAECDATGCMTSSEPEPEGEETSHKVHAFWDWLGNDDRSGLMKLGRSHFLSCLKSRETQRTKKERRAYGRRRGKE